MRSFIFDFASKEIHNEFMISSNKKFSNLISKLIKFKSETTRVPIKDTSWEELIWAALVFIYGEEKVDWDSQSHEKSVDIKANVNNKVLKISAKGGVIKNSLLSISSYRLTSFDKLADKLDFIKKQHNDFDFYMICAREIDKKAGVINYIVLKVPSTKLAPNSMLNIKNWKKTRSAYELKKDSKFSAKIVFKMSHQLWYSIPLKYFSEDEILVRLSIPTKELGKGLVDFLKRS